jgi:CHAD domain-containing protein
MTAKQHGSKWDERAGAAENARRRLPALVAGYFSTVRKFLAEERPGEELHDLRLETKRLRYTLELFRPCYGPGLESRLAALRRLQTSLGEVNDCAVTERLVSSLMPSSPHAQRVCRFLKEREQNATAEFRRHWAELFEAPGQESAWTTYLARNARAPRKRV